MRFFKSKLLVFLLALAVAFPALAINFQSNVFPPGLELGFYSVAPPALTDQNVSPIMQDASGRLLVSTEPNKNTYNYSVPAFSMVATPTTFLVIQGSATKTGRVKQIRVEGAATAAGNMQIQVQRWSTAGTLGSAVLTGLTAVKRDPNDGAATCVVSTVGTANYTTQGTGTAVPMVSGRLQFSALATGVAFIPWEFNPTVRGSKAGVLRGTSDFLVVSGNGSAIPSGGVVDITVEMEEDNS